MLPGEAIETAERVVADCALFFSVGTSSLVYPAARLAEIALERRAVVVEINPDPTPLTARADYVLPFASGRALPELVRRIEKAAS